MFAETLTLAVKQLDKLCRSGDLSRFNLIGGLAVARWGNPRSTGDIDFAIRLGNRTLDELAELLKGTVRRADAKDPLAGAVTFRPIVKRGAAPVQLVVFHPAWDALIFEVASRVTVGKLRIPVVDWRALILLKLYAGGALDFEDARRIFEAQSPTSKDLARLKARATKLRVSKKLERLVAMVGAEEM